MAWYKTNNPVGATITDGGRILCEILYAINEREHYMGYAETEWDGIGSYPAPNALSGVSVASTRPYIEAARGMLDGTSGNNLLEHTVGDIVYRATNDVYTAYNFGLLYATAMGSGTTWETANIAGHKVNDGRIFEELMKCVESLNHFTASRAYTSAYHKKLWIGTRHIDDDGEENHSDTTDGEYAIALTNYWNSSERSGESEGTPTWSRRLNFACLYAGGEIDKYFRYEGNQVFLRFTAVAGPTSPAPEKIYLRHKFEVEDYYYDLPLKTTTFKLYKILNTANYTNPSWTAVSGPPFYSQTFSEPKTAAWHDIDATYAFTFGTTNYIAKVISITNPFSADPNTPVSLYTWNNSTSSVGPFPHFKLRYYRTSWTYG